MKGRKALKGKKAARRRKLMISSYMTILLILNDRLEIMVRDSPSLSSRFYTELSFKSIDIDFVRNNQGRAVHVR